MLAEVTLRGMPAAKTGIAGEAEGIYIGNEIQLNRIVGILYPEPVCVYGLLLPLLR
jgi:hypothetical protein